MASTKSQQLTRTTPMVPHGRGTVVGPTKALAVFRLRRNCLHLRVLLTPDKRKKALWCFVCQPTIQSRYAKDVDGPAHASPSRSRSWYPHGQPCDLGSCDYTDRKEARRPSQNSAPSCTKIVAAHRERRPPRHHWCTRRREIDYY